MCIPLTMLVLWRCVAGMATKVSYSTVDQALSSLGETALQVARNLHKQGIKGAKSSAGGCPIANYLRREFGRDALVNRDRVYVMRITVDEKGKSFIVPSPVSNFIADFDNGLHPELKE
jgi:hypothetical protein